MTRSLYPIFGLAPSLIWLLFYLKRDVHPEPKRIILKIFVWGMTAAALSILAENLIWLGLSRFADSRIAVQIVYIFLGVALTEEFLKYLAVKNKCLFFKNGFLKGAEFDEPIDVMMYMIASALGFAALENLLILFSRHFLLIEALLISCLRFIGATLLHALCSATIGFFVALSFFELKKKKILLVMGFSIAVLTHGLYNFSIMKLNEYLRFFIPVLILIGLGIFVSFGFLKLKKIKGLCKIEKWSNF